LATGNSGKLSSPTCDSATVKKKKETMHGQVTFPKEEGPGPLEGLPDELKNLALARGAKGKNVSV